MFEIIIKLISNGRKTVYRCQTANKKYLTNDLISDLKNILETDNIKDGWVTADITFNSDSYVSLFRVNRVFNVQIRDGKVINICSDNDKKGEMSFACEAI